MTKEPFCICNHVLVRVLRDQPRACPCCGELIRAGEEVWMPAADAARLAAIGDSRDSSQAVRRHNAVAAMSARPLFQIVLRPEPGVDGWRSIRAVLRTALRRYGLRCVAITISGDTALLEESGASGLQTRKLNAMNGTRGRDVARGVTRVNRRSEHA